MPAPKQTWKLSSSRQLQARWFSHRTASSLMQTATGAPRSRKRHRTEAIAFTSFARILVKTCFSRSLLMLFSQLRVAYSRPLSSHSKARNHNPCRNDLTLNFKTSPCVRGLSRSSLDSCDSPGIVHWSSHSGTIALFEELSTDS